MNFLEKRKKRAVLGDMLRSIRIVDRTSLHSRRPPRPSAALTEVVAEATATIASTAAFVHE